MRRFTRSSARSIAQWSRAVSTRAAPAGDLYRLRSILFTSTGAFTGIIIGTIGSAIWFVEGAERLRADVQTPQTRPYASPATTRKGIAQIRQELGDDAVSTDEDDIEEHGFSEWSTSNSLVRPEAVVRPTSTEDVATIAKICFRYKIPMVPYGAGSSVEGNFSSTHPGICIDLSLMDKIVEFRPDDLDVTVQAGVNWMNLNENKELKETGLFLPLDPSPTAQIGGMIATNCSGTNALRYGTMKDYVLNLTVVLANGSIIRTRRRPRKTSAGYNLNGLFTGSEGTLGIITEATLKLAVVPSSYSVAIATFSTVKDAADAAAKMIRQGINLAACELMDDEQMKVINKSGGVGGKLWEELPTLFLNALGFQAHNKISRTVFGRQKPSVVRPKCQTFLSAKTKEEMDSLWSARKQALWACLATRPEGTEIWSTDVAVPISRMAQMIEESKTDAMQLGLFSSVLGHVGDGNFHQMVMYNPKRPTDVTKVKDFINGMMHKALEMEGTVSGEHGIGIGKKHCLLEELGPDTIGVMKAIKGRLDPHWLMNPGIVSDDKAQEIGSSNVRGGSDCGSHLEGFTAEAGVFQCEPSPIEPTPSASHSSARRRIMSAHSHNTADDLDLLTFTAASQQSRGQEVTSKTICSHSQASNAPTISTDAADWERFILIKRRILSKTELIEYLDFYFTIMWSLRPVVPPFYRDRDQYGTLSIEEPLLTLTLTTISSRYHICQRYLQSALWGSSYTRSSGAVASMLLLIEWHPKSINNTIAFSDDEEPTGMTTGPQEVLQRQSEPWGTQSGQYTSLTSQQRYGMATLLESLNIVAPAYRSNKMSWMLLSSAIALAQEGCCFDHDQQNTGQESLTSTAQSARDALRQQWNQLTCVFIYLTDEHLSLRLGLRPLLPESQTEAVRYRFSTTFASLLPDSALWESYYELFNETRKSRTLLQSLRKPGVSTPPSVDILPGLEHVNRALSRWRRSHENLKTNQSELLNACINLEYHYTVMYSCAPAGHVLHNNASMALADDKRKALLVLDEKAAHASRDILSIVTSILRPSHMTRYLPVRAGCLLSPPICTF
ncbi:hypothetical protein FOXG_16713 [Fusarium oxysporum f. sp. lycopersici 4287]|uniref:D-lactate dehydrogenase (cytochrome) n=1 Tax=Fusarium oxysporum f. sp. lycopersici (strain 4287 / CBS 123668 / FGSC 9935 / NRRL 34936) TaxID=426428 RepID=A0A0J9WA11_FUSO4|nr:hypothetical protein FOXG_16713 [Fusarium oxysporum f. sp. lycopersici 4287]KNB19430.1 hypothetical protein FOXG_16713 [Fusarium oxysporum f. sp. lycopersici 4287]